MTWLEKRLLETLEAYRKWYAAGLSDKQISQKIREEYPAQVKPIRATR